MTQNSKNSELIPDFVERIKNDLTNRILQKYGSAPMHTCILNTIGIYNGNLYENRMLHGFGVLEFDTGDVYTGEFQRGMCIGLGFLYYNNGDYYFGRWFNDGWHDKGMYFDKRRGEIKILSSYDGDVIKEWTLKTCLPGNKTKRWRRKEMRKKIIAVDFDGTLCKNIYPGIGEPRLDIIEKLLAEQKAGAKIILWTCRDGERLEEAVEWCSERGIIFDAVNESLPESIRNWKTNPRKICATEYWDDRAVKC